MFPRAPKIQHGGCSKPIACNFTHCSPRQHTCQLFVIMSATSVCKDKRIGVADGLKFVSPGLSLAQAMRAAEFTIAESKDCTLEQMVCRAYHDNYGSSSGGELQCNTPPPITTVLGTPTTTTTAVSSLTPDQSMMVLHPQPIVKRVRRTATGMQQDIINKN